MNNKKLCIVGHCRHGKDSMAEIFIYDVLKEKYGYKTPDECFEDRVNHRAEWHELICDYNIEDKSKLAKGILEHADCYVGMRDFKEIKECIKQNLFDLIIWVDASKRLPLESKESFNIDINDADIIIDNNGTFEEFKEKVIRLGNIIYK